jgi:hypothetical protein
MIFHSWLYDFQESDVLNCAIRPMSPHKRLPQLFATSAASESTPWEDYELLQFVVTTNFSPSWTL